MKIETMILGICLVGTMGRAMAGPPVDLTGGYRVSKDRRPLTENDLVYKANDQRDSVKTPKPIPLKYAVAGRSLPGRAGRELHQFRKGELVTLLKFSKDKRWVAVATKNSIGGRGPRRGWVPASVIRASDLAVLESSKDRKPASEPASLRRDPASVFGSSNGGMETNDGETNSGEGEVEGAAKPEAEQFEDF